MDLPPGVTSNDPEFARGFSAWLAESTIPVPADLRIRLEINESVPSYQDERPVFKQGDIDIQAGEPLGWAHIVWRATPATARIDEHRPHAEIFLSPAAISDPAHVLRSYLLVVMVFVWRRSGCYHIHGGTALDPEGRGWFLLGDSGSGKSTTIALLAARGWQVGTDDIGFLTANNGHAEVLGFRSPIALRPGGYGLLSCEGGLRLERRGKMGFQAGELGGAWLSRIRPDYLVFTRLGGEQTRLEPIDGNRAVRNMMQSSPWCMFEATAAQEHLDLLARLARQTRCYQATLAPDLFTAPGALGDFLHE